MTNGRFLVRKDVTFDSAHRLVKGYPGKCRHLHGHTWRATFEIAREKLDEYAFVRDFSDFKVIKRWIDDHLDHGTMLHEDDLSLLQALTLDENRVFTFPENPTSETLARFLFEKARELGLDVRAVEIKETCTSMARFEVSGP